MKQILLMWILAILWGCDGKPDSTNGIELALSEKEVLEEFKKSLKIKPEIVSISADTVIDKKQILPYYDSIAVEILNDQASKYEGNIATMKKWLEEGKVMNHTLTEKERVKFNKSIIRQSEVVKNIKSGGDKVDSTNTLKNIARMKKDYSSEMADIMIGIFEVEYKESDKAPIRYGNVLKVKNIDSLGVEKIKVGLVHSERNRDGLLENVLQGVL